MKKIIYVISWVVLMLIISFIAHALIEMRLIDNALATGVTLNLVKLYGVSVCALPVWLIYLLPLLAIGLGIWAGFFFWQKVYVEHLLKKIINKK